MLTAVSRGALLFQRNLKNLHRTTAITAFKGEFLPPNEQRRQNSTFLQYTDTLITSGPIKFTEDVLINLHDSFGLPWWATIVLVSVGSRATLALPMSILAAKNDAKFAALESQAKAIQENVMKEVRSAHRTEFLTDVKARRMFRAKCRAKLTELSVENNCHPMKSLLAPLVGIPVWISITVALRNISGNPQNIQGFTEQGALWFDNLALSDPFYIIPVILCLSSLLNVELNVLRSAETPSKLKKFNFILYRALSIVFGPIAAVAPTAISLYWLTNSLSGLAQNFLMMSPRFRKAIGLPKQKVENAHPYREVIAQLKLKLKPRVRTKKK